VNITRTVLPLITLNPIGWNAFVALHIGASNKSAHDLLKVACDDIKEEKLGRTFKVKDYFSANEEEAKVDANSK